MYLNYIVYNMNFLFGKKKNIPNTNDTINKLNQTLELLEKRERHLEKNISQIREEAKKLVKTSKNRAVLCLKKIKLYEKELESICGQKFNIELQISSLMQSITNKETINALRLGKDAMDIKTDPDKVADMVDQISENLAMIDDVSDAISKPIGTPFDDDDLLQELENDVVKEDDSHIKIDCNLPSIPSKKPIASKEDNEENELRELNLIMDS